MLLSVDLIKHTVFLTILNLIRVISLLCLCVLSGVNRCLSPTVKEKDLSLYSKNILGSKSMHGPSEIVTEAHQYLISSMTTETYLYFFTPAKVPYIYEKFLLYKSKCWRWRVGSVTMRQVVLEPGFCWQHSHSRSELSVHQFPEDFILSHGFHGKQLCMWYTPLQAGKPVKWYKIRNRQK